MKRISSLEAKSPTDGKLKKHIKFAMVSFLQMTLPEYRDLVQQLDQFLADPERVEHLKNYLKRKKKEEEKEENRKKIDTMRAKLGTPPRTKIPTKKEREKEKEKGKEKEEEKESTRRSKRNYFSNIKNNTLQSFGNLVDRSWERLRGGEDPSTFFFFPIHNLF